LSADFSVDLVVDSPEDEDEEDADDVDVEESDDPASLLPLVLPLDFDPESPPDDFRA